MSAIDGLTETATESVQDTLARFGAAMLSDAMGRRGALDCAITPVWPQARMVGRAFTVWTREGDNKGIHEALEVTAPGDVLVVAGQGSLARALIGEMIAIKAKARGLAGFVLDAPARDAHDLQELGVPVFSRGLVPTGPYKTGPFELGGSVCVAGVVVHPGDLVVGDRDGVTVVPAGRLDDVLAAAQTIFDGEVRKRVDNARPLA